MNAQQLIESLNLNPHPEGGYYRESYRSNTFVDIPGHFEGHRNCSTGIYFLLTKESKSHLHRIKSDEMWHFYAGDPLRIVMISPKGVQSEKILGPDISQGHCFQFVVPTGFWFGSEVHSGGEFGLAGCTVSPGFDFVDFEMAKKENLRKTYPELAPLIEDFCLN